tara:strand:+ start:919 stop:1104 length:186 start_codon:yes stop_codon:yes gene_type:complete
MSMDTSWIASAKYVEDEDGGKTITVIHTDGRYFSIPMTAGNRHYDSVLAWVAEGNKIADAD